MLVRRGKVYHHHKQSSCTREEDRQHFISNNIKKRKENPEALNFCTRSSHILLCCFGAWLWTSVSLMSEEGRQILSRYESKCTDRHVPAQSLEKKKKMKIYSLQGYDEVPRRQLGASVFSGVSSRMCFMYSTSLTKCSLFLKQQLLYCLLW